MILIIDNYDSFVHNLARYVRELGYETIVVRNDEKTISDLCSMKPRAIILSPGPGRPEGAGVCKELIQEMTDTPILGVCLGHQCLAEVYGGKTVPSQEPMHGRASEIEHLSEGVFLNISSPIMVGRYHSLSVALPEDTELLIQAKTQDGEIMAFAHKQYPHHGVQFHPESLLTEQGKEMISNFLKMIKGGE